MHRDFPAWLKHTARGTSLLTRSLPAAMTSIVGAFSHGGRPTAPVAPVMQEQRRKQLHDYSDLGHRREEKLAA